MNDIDALSDRDLIRRILLLKVVADAAAAEFKTAKKAADERLDKGATLPARSADDVKLGAVNKSDPNPVAVITDQVALEEYIRSEHADKLVPAVEFGPAEEILPVLMDAGRQDLFTQTSEIPGWLVQELQKKALLQSVPGIEVMRPRGTVSATSEPVASAVGAQIVARMLSAVARAGVLANASDLALEDGV